MTDTRYSAEELRKAAKAIHLETPPDVAAHVGAMLRQAARDAETLAGIRAYLARFDPTLKSSNVVEFMAADVLRELDRLSRGDA